MMSHTLGIKTPNASVQPAKFSDGRGQEGTHKQLINMLNRVNIKFIISILWIFIEIHIRENIDGHPKSSKVRILKQFNVLQKAADESSRI